jgi:hypothetical protein
MGETGLAPAVQGRRTASAASAAVLAVEAIGSLSMWALIPLAWLWIGGRAYAATGSLAADLGIAFFGFAASTVLMLAALNRIDSVWVALRQRAGHDQDQGALPGLVVASALLGFVLFLLWYYLFSTAYILPFMPSQ